jgi:hypothetical protein
MRPEIILPSIASSVRIKPPIRAPEHGFEKIMRGYFLFCRAVQTSSFFGYVSVQVLLKEQDLLQKAFAQWKKMFGQIGTTLKARKICLFSVGRSMPESSHTPQHKFMP